MTNVDEKFSKWPSSVKQIDKERLISEYNAEFIEDGIFVIHNFFPPDLVSEIIKEVESVTNWTYEENGHKFVNIYPIQNKDTVKRMTDIYEKFAKWPSFGENFSNLPVFKSWDGEKRMEPQQVPWVCRKGPNMPKGPGNLGNALEPHWDGDPAPKYVGKGDGQIQTINRVKWGGVIYLNNNFNGGEIVYTELGIEFKPVPGTMIMHVGDSPKYRHGTHNADAVRYNLIFNMAYGEENIPEPGEEVYRSDNSDRFRIPE